jgi:hypothetical protein
MGTMTLENQKPRRGRKPKKSSIYNLIQKNYGIDFTSDLLKNNADTGDSKKESSFDEPLNLCIREEKNKEIIPAAEINKVKKKNKSPPIFVRKDLSKNEVSICKFKLSNGNLEEKKKFSVVNGNFNYGNSKNSQLKKLTQESKITKDPNKMLKSFNLPCNSNVNQPTSTVSSLCNALRDAVLPNPGGGFLIQTHAELTSSQCGFYKFRHLKKHLSRYLTKNWKNYLPADSKVEKKLPFVNS